MNMTEFTEAQLEVMSKEKSPRGRKARMELERRKKMFNGEIVQENVEPVEDVVQESVEEPKSKRTRRKSTAKPAAKKSEDNS